MPRPSASIVLGERGPREGCAHHSEARGDCIIAQCNIGRDAWAVGKNRVGEDTVDLYGDLISRLNALFVLKGQPMEILGDRVDEGEVLRNCVMHVGR